MPSFIVTDATILFPERPVRPAVSTWTRLEPLPLTADLGPALQAAVADPLWLLGRQWQFLEFAGEDAGTPIDVRVTGDLAPLSRFLPAGSAPRAYSLDTLPLEVAVEQEPMRAAHPRLAAEAGQHLQRMLSAAGLDSLRDAFVSAYPLVLGERDDAGADADGGDWLALAAGRALDGRALIAALAPLRDATATITALPQAPSVPAASKAKVLDVLRRWAAWYDGVLADAGPSASWNPRRLEYSFAASSPALDLVADEYADGTLDWYSVDAAGAAPGTPSTLRLAPTLPSPVEYHGKPADRFWEFEDAAVHFGAIGAGPTDLARLLLVEFALVYGNDWFVVPVRLPVGALFRVTDLAVRDTFGVVTSVPRSPAGDGAPWSLFALAGDAAGRDWLFLPPSLAQTIAGEPIEQVALLRDEMANMTWGIEHRVQGASGDAYDRASESSRRAAQQQVTGPPVDAQLVYRLATSVPEHWIPFVPVPADGSAGTNPVIQLERRALVRTELDGQRRAVQPRGVLLRSDPRLPPDAEPPLRIEEEEVPREGAIAERVFQFARWFDGRSLLWMGRRKVVGRGEGSSGLRFDVLERR
jgi:hypothetical protein